MTTTSLSRFTTFHGHRRIASGSLQANALAAKRAREENPSIAVLIFEDATGRAIDIDLRGSDAELGARFGSETIVAANPADRDEVVDATHALDALDALDASSTTGTRGRGRPRLGVVPREVTLLPRHWDWLATQPGGASVVLRKLVDEGRRVGAEADNRRMAQERAYHFMQAIGGDLPGFEEATRALFANDAAGLAARLADWPRDVADHATQLAFGDAQGAVSRSTP